MNEFNKAVLRTLGADLQAEIHDNARAKGFWPPIEVECDYTGRVSDELQLAQKLALVHTEIAEATEVLRMNTPDVDREKFGEELADAVIRIMDVAARVGISLMQRIIEKHAINLQRPHQHGKRF